MHVLKKDTALTQLQLAHPMFLSMASLLSASVIRQVVVRQFYLAGLSYFIECNDGSSQSGIIGDDGLLPRILTHSQQGEFTVHWGDDAMEKLQA